jgi:hypothetical protein
MKTQHFYIDLTQRPTRSFRVRLATTWFWHACSTRAGRPSPTRMAIIYIIPNRPALVKFLGFYPDALLKELATGKADGEMLEWVHAHSKTPRSAWEIEAWSALMEKRAPDSDAETLAFFAEHLGRLSKAREDVKTRFEFGELDDYVSFGGKA